MSYDNSDIQVRVTRRLPDGKGGFTETTINLSGIPATASEDYIRSMRHTAHIAREMILDEIEGRVVEQVTPPNRFKGITDPKETAEATPTQAKSLESQINAVAANLLGEDPASVIPAAETVDTGWRYAFGIGVRLPDDETMFEIPISRINADGSGGGQLKAINTALSSIGYHKEDRFLAINALLHAFTSEEANITSTNDLTRADAHILLEWIGRADEDALGGLAVAVSQKRPVGLWA